MLKIWQVGALALLGVVLWILVTVNIRLMPNSFTDPLLGAFAFLLAFPAGWASVWLTKLVGRLSWDQLLPGVSVVAAVAMMMDGAALRWFSTVYSLNDTTVRLGAAWLLWGYGVALGVAVVMVARTKRDMASDPKPFQPVYNNSMEIEQKLEILADAAKYDASCASSGAAKRSSTAGKGLGSTTGMGICHSYTPDGRCVSLLKILLTNFCLYDCVYCVNRRSSDVQRARFTTEEVVSLTLAFYRRNYIEGLFLSSGIIRSADYTMEQLVEVARSLREDHEFRGYIHLKTIPEASEELIHSAGRYADRLSVNMELPTRDALKALAPEKSDVSIKKSMSMICLKLDEAKEGGRNAPKFSPAGQSTQIIVGAENSTDASILDTALTLYRSYRLKRVYYSAFSPIPHSSARLPNRAPPLVREHRLYQADWLLRYYEFSTQELANSMPAGNLDLNVDPKTAWALANRDDFPVDVNTADRHQLLRIPGLGVRVVNRILTSRRHRRLRFEDLRALGAGLKRARHFIVTADYSPAHGARGSERLRVDLLQSGSQQALF